MPSMIKFIKTNFVIMLWLSAAGIVMSWFIWRGCCTKISSLPWISILTVTLWIALWLGNSYLAEALDYFYSWHKDPVKRLIVGLVGMTVYSIGIVYAIIYFFRFVFGFDVGDNLSGTFTSTIIITLIISMFMTGRAFLINWRQAAVDAEASKRASINAQYESLKNQVNPHFLFNSLNVLSSLIEENPENAQRFTTSLSKIYRYVLEQKDKELVTVQEELTFAKTYMNLLKMRFENSISFELPEDFNNDEAKVVPLSLQLLLENTIKHNVVSEQKPLHIKIYIADNYLIVENNLQIKEVLQDRRGVGLQNIVNRYALISERKVLIEENPTYFKIKIPILTKQIVTMETQNIFNENNAYLKAKDRVEKLKGFYGNLISYCCVIPILAIINLNSGGFQWFWFPMMGWGMGVCFHALETFGYGKTWEEKKIQEILNKGNNQNTKWK